VADSPSTAEIEETLHDIHGRRKPQFWPR
jgi:hypothetical protein